MKYFINAKIYPEFHHIEVSGKLVDLPKQDQITFYLNKNFVIQKFGIIDDMWKYFFDLDGEAPQYVAIARPVHIILEEDTVEFQYYGTVNDFIDDVNIIVPDLVELAIYSAWFPFIPGVLFDYSLEIELPNEYTVISNGVITSEKQNDQCTIYHVSSIMPTLDIVICASPKLIKKSIASENLLAQIVYPRDFPQLSEGKLEAISEAYNQLGRILGPAKQLGYLTIVFSPRYGWGYARTPMFIRSGQYAAQQTNSEQDHHVDFHEMAHFWWDIADPQTTNDWINEGGAEYSAFILSKWFHGDKFINRLLYDYISHSEESITNTPIILTESTSPDRYVNRYQKVTLMYLGAEKQFGIDKFRFFLKAFYTKYKDNKSATTENFLEMAEDYLGAEASRYFQNILNLKSWKSINIRKDILKLE